MLPMLYGSGPVSSIMVNRFDSKSGMQVGGLLASAGMVGASFTTAIKQLYLTGSAGPLWLEGRLSHQGGLLLTCGAFMRPLERRRRNEEEEETGEGNEPALKEIFPSKVGKEKNGIENKLLDLRGVPEQGAVDLH